MERDLYKKIFVCVDTETTGLDTENDRIIEVAAVKFSLEKNYESFSTLINPKIAISITIRLIAFSFSSKLIFCEGQTCKIVSLLNIIVGSFNQNVDVIIYYKELKNCGW